MEKFKAVEKAMKTKAYSKEGLNAAKKLDPKEQAKQEVFDFLSNQIDELERQIETLEAEGESIQATMKKGKGQSSKAERMAEIERITEQHKWHQGKLELIKRSLENDRVETEQVLALEDSIKYYVTDGMNDDFMEDDEMYDELNLQEDEDNFGMNNDNDKVSSQDTQSIQEELPENDSRTSLPIGKSKPAPEPPVAAARRPSTQLKSPLPAMSTLHTPSPILANSTTVQMKPAALPTRPPGEVLKYASAAAAAAASDKMGIAPLPPPPEALPTPGASNVPPLAQKPSFDHPTPPNGSQPASINQTPVTKPSIPASSHGFGTPSSSTKSPALSHSSTVPSGSSISQPSEPTRPATSRISSGKAPMVPVLTESSKGLSPGLCLYVQANHHNAVPTQTNGVSNGVSNSASTEVAEDRDESIYHLPAGLQDLFQSYEAAKKHAPSISSQPSQRMLSASLSTAPDTMDSLSPRTYKAKHPMRTPSYYPQEVNPIFDDPHLYSRIDPDTLFYVFYYKQETYQQYLAAKALKDQSWRFHKQYQTWFQRHEEPKTITEEFEQGTYRFFDYESTWWGPYLTKVNRPDYIVPFYSRRAHSQWSQGYQCSEFPFEIADITKPVVTKDHKTQKMAFGKWCSKIKFHPEFIKQFGRR